MTPEERSEQGRRAHQARRAKLAAELNPDGTLSPVELQQAISEYYSQLGRRSARTRPARTVGPDECPAATQGADTCHGHPAAEPVASVQATRPQVADVMPDLLTRPDVVGVLDARDIAGLYLVLRDAGISQRQIAELTGQAQSEVSEIITGRQVRDVLVLERIADGLGIPRGLMRLAGGPATDAYPEEVTDETADPEGASAMLRRHLLASASLGAFGAETLGELLAQLPAPPPVLLPSRLDRIHIAGVQDLTRRLGEAGNPTHATPEILSAAANEADQLLDVPGTDPLVRGLRVAVAELHIEAGWAATSGLLYHRAMYHYSRAHDLATEAGDAYLQALALRYAGLTTIEHGHPDDGLKILQCGQVTAWKIPQDQERAVTVGVLGRAAVEAELLTSCAIARADMEHLVDAERDMAQAQAIWTPEPSDPFGDPDMSAARLALGRGHLDAAAEFGARSLRRCTGANITGRTNSGIVLATVYVRASEPRGLQMADDVIRTAAGLSSRRTRRRLHPLAVALDGRREPAARDLARTARRVAA